MLRLALPHGFRDDPTFSFRTSNFGRQPCSLLSTFGQDGRRLTFCNFVHSALESHYFFEGCIGELISFNVF